MRILVTGATGYIGGAVAKALHNNGHDVAALVRPDADTKDLRSMGCVLIAGDLQKLPSMRDDLETFDVFIHTAQSSTGTVPDDRAAIDTFTGLGKHFVYTSGVWVLGNTDSADEASPVNPLAISAWRAPHEELVLGAGGAVIRPGCVYGGRQSLLADWFVAADQGRPLTIVGEGRNHWAMVDLHELADLYVRVAEGRIAGMLHGIDDTEATIEECARAVAPNGTIEKVPLEAARTKLGAFADALAVDQKISSNQTRLETGWNPWRTFTSSVATQWQEWRAASSAATE